jgi:hypothetical protein
MRRLASALLVLLLARAVSAGAVTSYAYPLKVSSNGRYLVDQNNVPWRVQADAGWLMSTNATPAEVDIYLATRKLQGFNSFYLYAMSHPGFTAAPHAPLNYNGDPPFATPNVFSTAGTTAASERYWAWIDSIIDKAAANDMVVMFAYTYLGFGGGSQGWYQELLSQPSRQACTNWGRWLGNRYKDKSNIIWLALGDYTPPAGSEGEARTLAVIDGIKAAGATQLFMAEPTGGSAVPTLDATAFASVIDMNSFYGYGPTGRGENYIDADRAWNVSPAKPAWVQEGGYEYENNTGGFTGQPYETRRTRFWAVLGGGTAGDGFGSYYSWQWLNFPGGLSTPGAAYSTHAFGLFASLPWWDLRPSGTAAGYAGKDLITSGRGTRGQADYVTSALTTDGRYLLAYIPTTGGTAARTITVDMTAMSGTTRARWFNPASGLYVDIASGAANDGMRSFTSPGDNGTGTNDWVLVLEATPSPFVLTVATAGTGRGTVTSSPAGISCGAVCSASYDPGTTVTLTAAAAAGSAFSGWSGACSGTGSCQVKMSAPSAVTATFSPPSLSIDDVAVDEGDGESTNATFDVTLSAVSVQTVTVNYATRDGTAIAGTDYRATSGTLTFTANQTHQTVAVPVLGDTKIEADKTFTVTLSGAEGSPISRAQGTALIRNDDFPALSIDNATVTESDDGKTNAVFTVSLSAPSLQTVTANYATADGTATAGRDYSAQAGSLIFAPGQTSQTISIGVNSDATVEPNETFMVNLSNAVNATLADAQGLATITDRPRPTGGLVAAYAFDEGTGATVGDASGNGLAGRIVGATWTTAGKYGGALSFNGWSSYVDLGNPTGLQITGSMTWSAWILATANPPDDGQIIAKSYEAGWQFKTSPDTGPHTFGTGVSTDGTSLTQRYSKTVRELNTWYHVAGVYNAVARTLAIYVNGVLDNGVLRGTVPAGQYNAPQNVTIGRRAGGFYFQGRIDEVRVYDRALSQAEIQADMKTPLGVP